MVRKTFQPRHKVRGGSKITWHFVFRIVPELDDHDFTKGSVIASYFDVFVKSGSFDYGIIMEAKMPSYF